MTEKLTAIVSSASAGKKFLKSSHQKSQPIGQLEKSNKNRGFPYKQKEFFNENILKRFSMINKKRGKQLNFSPYIVDPSLPVPDINERFVDACENGDYPTVTKILESIKDFNIDVTDNLGRSALRLAVENEHLEVVQALLSKSDSPKMREALLLAIYLGHTQIAESILRHPKFKVLNEKKFVNGDTDSFWQTPSSDDAQFPPDITPLILAAQYNRIEIVQILLINGDRITKPHDFHCKCTECLNRFKFDSLRHAQSRLNAYRGLASESYISLASMDPILTSFELGHELKMLSAKEKYFKNEYLQLSENLSIYVCKLLSNVRGRDELEIVLNKSGKETEEKYERLARLDLALKYEEKPFVAHSNCQQKLVEIWYSGIRKVSKMNKLVVLLLIVFFIFILPFNIIIYIFAPQSKFGKFMYQPCIKFLSHTIAYLIFITLLIISSVQFAVEQKNTIKLSQHLTENFFKNYSTYMSKNDLKYKFDFENIDFSIRRDSPSVIDITITIFIVGFFWQEVKHVFYYGIRDYLRSWNNMVNSLMNVLYISSFGLKYYTMYIASFNKKKVLEKEFWDKAVGLNGSSVDEQKKIYDTIYWLNNDRYYWVSFDPINMAEGLFAVANLFSFSKICFLLPANQQLGPLQISLGNMISDIVKFVTIFVIIFIAFSFAINNLYWYYQKPIREQSQVFVSNKSIEIKAEEKFGTIWQTFLTMFWSLFGLGEQDSVNLSPYKNKLTEAFGTLLYAFYHISSIIVLLNMLVASMTQSYEKILRESDIEWKFARSKLYMEYIKDGGTLPVPINIIPTPKSIFYMFKKLTVICLRKKENTKHERSNLSDQFQLDIRNNSFRKTSVNEELTYIKVMQRIVKRFLLHKQRESDEVGETDLEELKQDLQMSRYETLNDLKRIRDENYRLMGYLSQGILLIGEEIFKDHKSENAIRFRDLKNAELEYQEALDDFDKKENQIKSFNHRFKSDSIDSGLQSIRDLTTVMHSNCQIPSLDKKTKSMESLSSSDTLSENSNDQKIENIQLNESAKFEINVDVDSSDLASVDLQLNEESIDYQKIKNNNLHVINEEDEISTDSISRKE